MATRSGSIASPDSAGTLKHLHCACTSCKSRKIRCNGEHPVCSACSKHGRECQYQPLRPRGRKKRVAGDTLRTPARDPAASTSLLSSHPRHGGPTPLAAKRQCELRTGMGLYQASNGIYQYYGPASNLAFLQRFYQRIHRNTNDPHSSEHPGVMDVWGVDQFVLPCNSLIQRNGMAGPPAHLPKELGDCFIETYFKVCHPQYPFLLRSEIQHVWASSWEPPLLDSERSASHTSDVNSKNILLMVLAIGAIMSSLSPDKDAKVMERWACDLSSRVQLHGHAFEDVSVSGVQLLLLKSIFGIQQMRPNDAYLSAGHAALKAMALGMNLSQVIDSARSDNHRLRVTFYSLYFTERFVSFCHGRPSCLNDDMIDICPPEDLHNCGTESDSTSMAYLRAMAALGKTADRINRGIYFVKSGSPSNLSQVIQDCDAELDEATRFLPPFLHFYDTSMPPSVYPWQEVQRTHLGLAYYQCRILLYRPSVCFMSMHQSRSEAQAEAATLGMGDLHDNVSRAMTAAKSLIELAYEACLKRAPYMRQDSAVAYNVIGACLTLLYQLLDGPGRTSNKDASAIFKTVEDGIHCLDFMKHPGPRFGKLTLSDRIMSVAKAAFRSACEEAGDASAQNHEYSDNVVANDPTSELDLPHLGDDFDMLLKQFPWLE